MTGASLCVSSPNATARGASGGVQHEGARRAPLADRDKTRRARSRTAARAARPTHTRIRRPPARPRVLRSVAAPLPSAHRLCLVWRSQSIDGGRPPE
eukprot:1278717-Prymnesium_polylepis.2